MASFFNNIAPATAFFHVNPVSSYAPASSFSAPTNWQKQGVYTPPLPQRVIPKAQADLKAAIGKLPSLFQFNIGRNQ